jgi:chromosome segregation ATPase
MSQHKADIGMNHTDKTQTQEGTQCDATAAAPPVTDEIKSRISKTPAPVGDADRSVPQALHDTFLDERNDVMQVINELEDQLDRHQEVRATLERELTDANEKVQTATQRIQELEWQTVTLQTRIESLEQVRQEIALLEAEVAAANDRVQRLNDEHKGVEKERTRLRNELKAANKQLEELWAVRKDRDGLRSDMKNQSTRIEELERSQRDTIEERGQLQVRLQEAQAALQETLAERQQHQDQVRVAEDRTRELLHIQEELADKLETARAEKKNLQAQLTHIERENIRMVEQRQYYETELTSLRNSHRVAEAALSGVKKAFSEVRVALTETKARARRRMIETWPRLNTPLRGMGNLDAAMSVSDVTGISDLLRSGADETAAATTGNGNGGDGNGQG